VGTAAGGCFVSTSHESGICESGIWRLITILASASLASDVSSRVWQFLHYLALAFFDASGICKSGIWYLIMILK